MNRYHVFLFAAIISGLILASDALAAPSIGNVVYSTSRYVNQQNSISANITDITSNITNVLLSITSPEVNNYPMANVSVTGSTYQYNFTPRSSGTYTFYIWASNANGQTTTSQTYNFVSIDDRPSVADVVDYPDPVVSGTETIYFYASVTDPDENMDEVWVQIRYPQNETQNITMTNISNTFVASFVPQELIEYKYTVWASDYNGNIRSAERCTSTTCFVKEYTFNAIRPTPIIRDIDSDNDNFYVRLPIAMPEPSTVLSANITDPYGSLSKVGLRIFFPNGTLERDVTLTSATEMYTYEYYPQEGGAYTYMFYANDTSGTSATASATFTTIASKPTFNDITIDPEHTPIPAGRTVTITVNVSDPHDDLDSVFLRINAPAYRDVQMQNVYGNRYSVTYTVMSNQVHYFYIYANDSRNNIGRSFSNTFSDEIDSEDLNVSVETEPKCCAIFDYMSLDYANDFTGYSTYNPFFDYTVLEMRETTSMLSNCGNLAINVTNNCLTLRKEVIEEGQENITITGDTSTNVVAYCCWNEDNLMSAHDIPYGYGTYASGYGAFGGPTYFCEWDKSIVSMPPFMINTYEDFWMFFSYSILYHGWYNITASAYYERYNQSDCDIYGINDPRCQCQDVARMTIRFLKEEEEGTTPEPIPFPIPIPVSGEFISEPDIVIIREMPEYIYQGDECDENNPWNTCSYTKVRLVLYNRGSLQAQNVTINDTSIVSDDMAADFCVLGGDRCDPVAYQCINKTGQTCMEYNDTTKSSSIHFELDEPIYPRDYKIVEYRFIPTSEHNAYNATDSVFYDFDAKADYVYWKEVGEYNVNLSKTVNESVNPYNPENSDRLYLYERPAFSYDATSNIYEEETIRNFPIDTFNVFRIDVNAILGNSTIDGPWNAELSLDDSWTVAGCTSESEIGMSCSYSNTDHKVRFEGENQISEDRDNFEFTFTAKTTKISEFLVNIDSVDNDSMSEEFIPGIFLISDRAEYVSRIEPNLVVIREMVPHINQKEGCQTINSTWDNCTSTKIRLIIYNRGAATATDTYLTDYFDDSYCLGTEEECEPEGIVCISGYEMLESVNVSSSTNETGNFTGNETETLNETIFNATVETRPYTCRVESDVNGTRVEFNITDDIEPFDYRIVEYEIATTVNLDIYDGNSYYLFEAEVEYNDANGKEMPKTFEDDYKYNPEGSNYLYLDNRTVFEFDLDIEKDNENDTLDRDFAYGVDTWFYATLKARTGNLTVAGPWYADLFLPYSWGIGACETGTGVSCEFNSSMHWIRIASNNSLEDEDIIEFRFNASAREMKDFLINAFADDNSTTNPMDENYMPGLWTVGRLTHFVNVTILEPYPSPVPEPEPEPDPYPIPEPIPDVNEEPNIAIVIKPLNWTLTTYQGEGIPVSFEIENIGNSTITDITIDALRFEGWEYESANIASIDPGEKLIRTIFVKPGADARPGYYVIAVRGFVNDSKVLDIAYFQLDVLEGIKPAKIAIVEFSSALELEGGIETYVPVLLKNTGTVDLHNVTIEIENLDECIEEFEPFMEDIDINETLTMYFKVKTKDQPGTCKGSIIIKSLENAYAFSGFKVTIEAPAPLIPRDYTTIIILAAYAAIMTIYALYRRKHAKDDIDEDENKDPIEKRRDIYRYLLRAAAITIVSFAVYYAIWLI